MQIASQPRLSSDIRVTGADVRPLKYYEIPIAVKNIEDAFATDPIVSYVQGPLPTWRKLLHCVEIALQLVADIRVRSALTVHGGDAVASIQFPGSEDKLHKFLFAFWRRVNMGCATAEQNKRKKELGDKWMKAQKEAFGDRSEEMMHLYILATAPKKQGNGYGTALATSVTTKADSIGCATALLSSNVLNTEFYQSCGFSTVVEFTLGENNPAWKKSPVIARLMVREPYSTWSSTRKSARTTSDM